MKNDVHEHLLVNSWYGDFVYNALYYKWIRCLHLIPSSLIICESFSSIMLSESFQVIHRTKFQIKLHLHAIYTDNLLNMFNSSLMNHKIT